MDEDNIVLLQEIWFTDVHGNQARIVGDPPAINSLIEIFKRVGVTYDEQSGSWDEGYYCEPSPSEAASH